MRCSTQPVLVLTILVFASPLLAQSCSNAPSDPQVSTEQPSQSVAELARSNKNKKLKAKAIVTDNDLELRHGPIPSLNTEGLDNSDEIVGAIKIFSKDHKPEQTEIAVHDWYDRYDSMMEAAIRQNIELRDLLDTNNFNGYTICQEKRDYQSCVARRQVEMRSARQDQMNMQKNGRLIGRIQQAFMRVRPALASCGISYEWFKIRNADDNGSF